MVKKILKKILMALGAFFVVLVLVIGFVKITSYFLNLGSSRMLSPNRGGLGNLKPTSYGVSSSQGKIAYEERAADEGRATETSRMVIKSGTLNIVVKDIEGTVEKIVQYTQEKSGWVVSSRVTEVKEVPSGMITVRVPTENFDEAIDYFKGLAEKVSYEGTNARDVTEEYVDLQSRLKNLEATEAQLLKIMERSGTIPDVLAVQRELTNVRGQIEMTKGRMQYLERNVEMASITVNLALAEEVLPIPPSEKWLPVYVAKRAWRSVLASLRAISYLLIWIGVYSLIWLPLGLVVWQGRKWWQRRKRKEM